MLGWPRNLLAAGMLLFTRSSFTLFFYSMWLRARDTANIVIGGAACVPLTADYSAPAAFSVEAMADCSRVDLHSGHRRKLPGSLALFMRNEL